jgi:hypothetical protein
MDGELPQYDPFDWYWEIGGDTSKYWSSKAGAYVPTAPPERLTHIHSVDELNDVLRGYGLKVPAPKEVDFSSAVQKFIDETAKARGYNDGVSLAGYVNSTFPSWAAEAQAFIAWRDQVWFTCYQTLSAVQGGKMSTPAIDQIIAALPKIQWPGGA